MSDEGVETHSFIFYTFFNEVSFVKGGRGNMRYNVLVDETYVNRPAGVVHVNGRTVHTCNTLDEVLALITETSKKLHKECDILREWSSAEQGSVVHKILYTRRHGTGRLLTKFKVSMLTKVVYNDSLI